jgi:hypothetical protein
LIFTFDVLHQEQSNTLSNKPNGDPVTIMAKISNEPTLPITTIPVIYSMNCCPKKRKRKKKTKRKKKRKKRRGAKSMENHGPRDIFMSTLESVSKLDEHSRKSPQLQETSIIGKRVLDNKSQKDNSSLFRSISYSSENGRQNSLSYDSKEQRFESFPTKSKWDDNSSGREMGLWELFGNNPLDSSIQVDAKYSDQYGHNQCANERKDSTFSELRNLPGYICEQLEKIILLNFTRSQKKIHWTL